MVLHVDHYRPYSFVAMFLPSDWCTMGLCLSLCEHWPRQKDTEVIYSSFKLKSTGRLKRLRLFWWKSGRLKRVVDLSPEKALRFRYGRLVMIFCLQISKIFASGGVKPVDLKMFASGGVKPVDLSGWST